MCLLSGSRCHDRQCPHDVYFVVAEKEKRATAVALKLENERRAGETARLAKAEQHRAVQQHQKQAAQEVMHLCCFTIAVVLPCAAHACLPLHTALVCNLS